MIQRLFNMKYSITFFAIVLMALAIPQSVKAYDFSAVAPTGQILYYTIQDSVVEVTYPGSYLNYYNGFSSPAGALTIPSTVTNDGISYPVSVIGSDAFRECHNLTSVTIPSTITLIGSHAFCGCTALTSVTIPNTVSWIGPYAFYGCSNLDSMTLPDSISAIGERTFQDCSSLISITIPNSVTSIGIAAFYGCSSLYSVTIPNSVVTIGNWAFRNCTGLISVIIPNSVHGIGNNAFQNCSSLTSVFIPDSVTWIGDDAFRGCSGLSSIQVSSGNNVYDSRNNCNAIIETAFNILIHGCNNTTIPNSVTGIDHYAFYNCSGLISATIPDSVYWVGNYAFAGCSGLTSVTIGNSVTGFGNYAFQSCSSLTEITCLTSVAPALGNHVFNGVPSSIPIYVLCESMASYQSTWAYFSNYNAILPYILNIQSNNEIMGNVSFTVTTCDTIVLVGVANYGYHFTQWNDGNSDNPRTIILTQDTSFTAQFAKNQYTVNVNASHSDRGVVTGGCTVDYLDSITLTATVNYGYHFDHWSDGSIDNPHTIIVLHNVTLTAFFEPNQYVLAVESSDATRGYVSGGGNYDYLNDQIITATANYGYHFTQWNDGDTNPQRIITLTSDTSFIAFFSKNQYTLTLLSNDETQGTVSDGGIFEYLDTVTVAATAFEHHHFVHWNDGSHENPREIVIDGNTTITAIFAIDTHIVRVVANDIARGVVGTTGNEFAYGTPCTATATAYTGYVFSRWSNGVTANPYTFAVLEDIDLLAIFEEEGMQGIEETMEPTIACHTHCGVLYVAGAMGKEICVITIDGRIIKQLQCTDNLMQIVGLSSGVYLIKIGDNYIHKIIITR